jgi:peptide/nickel transport system substrate-binding protein
MKRLLSFVLCLLMISALLVSCAPRPAPPDTKPPPTPQSEIVRGGTLVAAMNLKWTTFNTPLSTSRNDDRHITGQIYETLIRTDASGNLLPGLARSWDVLDDGLTIVLKLRDDVYFTDGTKFNAEAVKFVMDWYKSEGLSPFFKGEIAELSTTEVVDEYTVKFTMSGVSSSFLVALANYAGIMISPEAIKKGNDFLATNTIGTGPFILKEAIEGDHVVLARNEKYYEMGDDGLPLPYLDEIIIKIIPEDTVKATNLRSGDIYLADKLTVPSILMLEKVNTVETFEIASGQVLRMGLNHQSPKYKDNPLLRQAIHHAINGEELCQAILQGHGYVPAFLAGKDQWFYLDYNPYPFNPALAREKVAKAGYPDGKDLKFTLTNISREPDNTLVQLVQVQLKENLGAEVVIQTLERLAWVDLWCNSNESDIGIALVTVPRVDPYTQMSFNHLDFNAYKATGYDQQEYKDLILKVKGTFDTAEQLKYLHEAQKVYKDYAADVILYFNPHVMGRNINLHGVMIEKEGSWILREAWIDN